MTYTPVPPTPHTLHSPAIIRIGVPVLLCLFPLLAVYSHMGISILAVLLSLILVIGTYQSCGWAVLKASVGACKWILVGIAALLLWGISTSPWALNPNYALQQSMELLLVLPIIPALLLIRLVDDTTQDRILWIMGIGFFVGLTLLAVEGRTCYTYKKDIILGLDVSHCGWLIKASLSSHFNNNFFIFIMLSPWVGQGIAQRFNAKGAKVVGYLGVQIFTYLVIHYASVNASSLLLFIMVNGVFTMAWIMPHFIRRAMVTTALILGIGLVPASHYIVKNHAYQLQHEFISLNSEKMRIEMWDYAGQFIAQNPIIGIGFKNGRFVPSTNQPFLSVTHDNQLLKDNFPVDIYNHPHNMFVELQLDLGYVGFGLGVVLILILAWHIKNAPLSLHPYYLSAMAGSFALYNVGMSLWRSWWLALIILLVAMVPLLVKLRAAPPNHQGTAPKNQNNARLFPNRHSE